MKNLVKFVCSNGHELSRSKDKFLMTFDVKEITHPKLKSLNLKNGDYLKKCPDCNASTIITKTICEEN